MSAFHDFLQERLRQALEETRKDPYDYGTVKLWVGDALAILDALEQLAQLADHNERWAKANAKALEKLKERV